MQAPINVDLSQLQTELVAAGVDVQTGLTNNAGTILRVASNGTTSELPQAAAAVFAAHVPSTALHDKVVALQAVVGVQIDTLTNAQLIAMVKALLYKAGAFDKQTLAVKPLAAWLL